MVKKQDKKQIVRCSVMLRIGLDNSISIHRVPKDIFEQLAEQADDNGIYDSIEWADIGKVIFYKE